MAAENCEYPKCGAISHVTYIDKTLCRVHWNALAACEAHSPDERKMLRKLGLFRGNKTHKVKPIPGRPKGKNK